MTEALQSRPTLPSRRRVLRIADGSTTHHPRPTTPLHERDLARLWEAGALPAAAIIAQDGTPLQVVYRGRPNSGAGPDFRDAVIALPDAGLLHGDVELHLLASDFRRHGHDRDPAYARVILHLVYRADDGPTTVLPGGRTVRVVAIEPWLGARAAEIEAMLAQPALWREPCQTAVERMGAEAVAETLARLGERRLREKAAALARRPPAVALYEGLLRTLGHGAHVGAWLELARRVPAAGVAAIVAASSTPEAAARTLEALLLATAGLLPPVEMSAVGAGALNRVPTDGAGESLQKDEAQAAAHAQTQPFPLPLRGKGARRLGPRSAGDPPAPSAGVSGSGSGQRSTRPRTPRSELPPASQTTDDEDVRAYLIESWQRWRACGAPVPFPIPSRGPRRPANHPALRLAGLARLLGGGPDGLLQRARASLLLERVPARALVDLLTVGADGLWQLQALPWAPASAPLGALIGRDKAVELALNAVLPVLLAEAEREQRPLLVSAVLRAFHALPAAAAYGRTAHLTRALRSDGGSLLRGADRAQGGLHLYAHYCTQGGCGRCPLS